MNEAHLFDPQTLYRHFSGLVGAYGSEEESTFLATQQVDEARHMQFYARLQDEVVADPAAIATHVERAREQISPAFRAIFDVALVEHMKSWSPTPATQLPRSASSLSTTRSSREPSASELLPAVSESLTPPDRDGADWNALGASAEEIRDFAIGGLTRRLDIVGVPLSSL